MIGILIPERWTHAIGIPESAYRWFCAAGRLAAALIAPWFRGLFSGSPDVAAVANAPVISSGAYETISKQLFGRATNYDVFLLEYDHERSGSFSARRAGPRG